jgi:uncharacterized protein with HEPN domain
LKRNFDLYLKDILEAIERVQEYTESMDIEELTRSKLTMDAVMRNLEVIGEATTQVPQNIKDKYKDVLWKDIQDFRIVVAHHYWKVNIARVCDIVENKLDALKQQIQNIIEKEMQEKNKNG